jgi:hypothetical protein
MISFWLDSTAIQSIIWDDGELSIYFVDGRAHVYFRVPEQVAVELANADSAGRYFNAYIRDVYTSRRES